MTQTAESIAEIADVDLLTVARLTREMKAQAAGMGRQEARYLVDAYYQIQDYRKASANQERAGEQDVDEAPLALVGWLSGHMATLELRIKNLLGAYGAASPVGAWSQSICGIGPVISAGLLAHIEIEKAPTAGHIWRFAGLDPTSSWGKGEKRPWNADLKCLCWKIGESFVKTSGMASDFYGKLWIERKAYEQGRNDRGELADQAAQILATKTFKRAPVKAGSEDAVEDFKRAAAWYAEGKLPPAHIHARAKRWTVKLFLAHWQHVAWESTYGTPPAKPYVIDHGGHVHEIRVPNWPVGDLETALPV